jgi:hypothetical protein
MMLQSTDQFELRPYDTELLHITIDQLAKVAGILGFGISVMTFALTRWERRAAIAFGLDEGTYEGADVLSEEIIDIVNLTLTNVGASSLLVNLRTLQIASNGNILNVWREDYIGIENREVLLKPNDVQVIGLPAGTFREALKIKAPKKYDDQSFYVMLPIKVSVSTTTGKVFSTKKLKYWEATGEFHRA